MTEKVQPSARGAALLCAWAPQATNEMDAAIARAVFLLAFMSVAFLWWGIVLSAGRGDKPRPRLLVHFTVYPRPPCQRRTRGCGSSAAAASPPSPAQPP